MLAVATEPAVPESVTSQHSNSFLLWQLADSAFPIGSFAHSGGLEAAWQHGQVRTRADLRAFLKAQVTQCGQGSLPFVSHAHLEPERLPALDAMFDAFTTNHVANRASRLQGAALTTALHRAFGVLPPANAAHSHFAPLFGALLSTLGIERHACLRLFLFGQCRSAVSSAVRLGIVGPLEAQAIQHALADHLEHTLQRAAMLSLDQIAQTAPIADLWQGAHDRLYSRLFQS